MPAFFGHVSRKLSGTKFYMGDEIKYADFILGGFFVNNVHNPSSKFADRWQKVWESAPENVKTYVANFQEEMKDYLASRPKNCSI